MWDLKKDLRDVWTEYARTRTKELRNALMEHYLHLVKRMAQRIHAKLPREVELDDLISAGTFGLMYAISAFDLGRSVKFETYCAGRIRGAILDELRSWDWVPRLARLRAHKLLTAERQLKLQLGREPTSEELAQHLRVSMREMEKITRDGNVVRVMPLSAKRLQTDDQDQDGSALEDRRATERVESVEREDIKRMITRNLSRAEQLIIVLYYFEEMTMREIGQTLDLSESRVSQMHAMVLARLQAELSEQKKELVGVAAA
jgi:RNA polymerase sigma factor for flagellar operon FliA